MLRIKKFVLFVRFSLAVFFTCSVLSAVHANELIDTKSLAQEVEKEVISWRRDLHQHPELSNREFRTSKIIEKHLISLG